MLPGATVGHLVIRHSQSILAGEDCCRVVLYTAVDSHFSTIHRLPADVIRGNKAPTRVAIGNTLPTGRMCEARALLPMYRLDHVLLRTN